MPRKKPYSGAKKKKQLQERRAKKRGEGDDETENHATKPHKHGREASAPRNPLEMTLAEGRGLRTIFHKEPKEVIEERKLASMQPLVRKGKKFEKRSFFGECLDIPTRPPWDYNLTKEKLEQNEENMFKQYLDDIYNLYPSERLNYFEHNLNVWRQLWRVVETSDILCVLADCRNPLFHFPPSLYRYIVHKMKKPLILVLTKADLVPADLVHQWTKYFHEQFPGLIVTSVNSFTRFKTDLASGKRRRNVVKLSQRYNGRWDNLIQAMNNLIVPRGGEALVVPNPQHEHPIDEEGESGNNPIVTELMIVDTEQPAKASTNEGLSSDSVESDVEKPDLKDIVPEEEDDYAPPKEEHKRPYVTLGFVGSPNVGKSTLINALKGRKMCSESRTPGHTKHRQTLYLNPTVVLADCPGLVYPATDIPKQLQVLCGIFPVAQIREPYSSIQFIAEHIPIETLYALKKPEEDEPWSAYGICDAYAEKRGYFTKNGRTNPYKAGLEILYDVIDGKVEWYFDPSSTSINLNAYTNAPIPRPTPTKEANETNTQAQTITDSNSGEDSEESSEEEVQAKSSSVFQKSSTQKPTTKKQQAKDQKSEASTSEEETGSTSDDAPEATRYSNPFAALK